MCDFLLMTRMTFCQFFFFYVKKCLACRDSSLDWFLFSFPKFVKTQQFLLKLNLKEKSLYHMSQQTSTHKSHCETYCWARTYLLVVFNIRNIKPIIICFAGWMLPIIHSGIKGKINSFVVDKWKPYLLIRKTA